VQTALKTVTCKEIERRKDLAHRLGEDIVGVEE
jgi:hypothetical protein